MKGAVRLFSVFGISVNIHVTFFLLILLFLSGGLKWLVVIAAIFCFVTLHEICHALAAKRFGIDVREITLLPIGGVASMTKMPEKPSHEFFISIAGPMFNILVIAVFHLPMRHIVGQETLSHPLSTATWPLTIAYIYWINLALALFNLIPAFPMDGGRILRALLASKIGFRKATKIAVNFGHAFALIFAYLGILKFNLMLIAIAIFIYMAASSEEVQTDIRETLKKIRVRDILSKDFFTLSSDTPLSKVIEVIFRSRQEDFPIIDSGKLAGFITRQDIVAGIHRFGMDTAVGTIMRRDFPLARESDTLVSAHSMMQQCGMSALPVVKSGEVLGIITMEDIGRIYAVISEK
jgi:Zn-dependent protease